MKISRLKIASTLLLLQLAMVTPVKAAASLEDCLETLEKFKQLGTVPEMLGESYGYAVLPTIGKGGIGIGGAHGKGKVYSQGTPIGKTTMSQLTIGLQLGGQAYSQIIFFEDATSLEQFTSGNFEFSAQATAVAITAGVSAEANTGGGAAAGASGGKNDASTTSGGYRKGMAIFTVAKGGLMYEASLGGQKFSYEAL